MISISPRVRDSITHTPYAIQASLLTGRTAHKYHLFTWYSCFTAFSFNGTILCWCYRCIVKKLITDSLTYSRKLKIFSFKIHNSIVTRAILFGSNMHQIVQRSLDL